MNVAFSMIVFNGEPFLRAAIEAVLPFGPVFVAEGPVEYWRRRGFDASNDGTMQILNDMLPAHNIVTGEWTEKDEQQKAVAALIPEDTDYVIVVDSDEVWDRRALLQLLHFLHAVEPDAVAVRAHSIFCGFDHIMGGFEADYDVWRAFKWKPGETWAGHRPPMPSRCGQNRVVTPDIRYHHYSYCLPLQTAAKAAYYEARAPQMCIPDWFDGVWLPWALQPPKRQEIEARWEGVHNWLPMCRTPTPTIPWAGGHPEPVADRLEQYRRRFNEEIDLCLEARSA